MGRLSAAIVALSLTFSGAAVSAKPHGPHIVHRGSHLAADSGFYTNVSGHHVHRPVSAYARPAGATARCGDGSWSFSENHRGTCSHHGGVNSWL